MRVGYARVSRKDQRLPEAEEMGIEVAEDDILLRKPAIVVKPLCIYRG